jgi:hypothetical protein
MRYIVAAATAFALMAGITLGFILSRGFDGPASAAPPARAVEEQNLDANGFIRVHEQGTSDVNVVSLPWEDGLAFTHVQAKLCTNSPTGFCVPGTSDALDLNTTLTSLSIQGWRLVEINAGEAAGANEPVVLYTLSAPAP